MRRIIGGQPASVRFILGYFFGPFLLDEFERINASEASVLAAGGEGESVKKLPMARLSFLQLAEALSLRVEARKVLPLRSNRARGDTVDFEFGVHRTTVKRLYSHFYHGGERGTRDMTAVRHEKWDDLLQSSFEHLGATFYNTGHYDRLIDTASTIAAALGFMLVEDAGRRLLQSGALEGVVTGDARQLRVVQSSSR
jgi:hypothetical protein